MVHQHLSTNILFLNLPLTSLWNGTWHWSQRPKAVQRCFQKRIAWCWSNSCSCETVLCCSPPAVDFHPAALICPLSCGRSQYVWARVAGQMFLWLSGRALRYQRKRLWVQFPGTHILIKEKCTAWMHSKSLWIKASAKCINVNVLEILYIW